MSERKCIDCGIPMEKTFFEFRGTKFEARQCPKCKEKILTEDLAMKAISKIESRKLNQEYIRHPIRIGRSWAMTFPKDLTEIFNLGNSKIELKLCPKLEENKIEIVIEK